MIDSQSVISVIDKKDKVHVIGENPFSLMIFFIFGRK